MAQDVAYNRSVSSKRSALTSQPLAVFLGTTLVVRVLTDNLSSPNSRHSATFNMSGVIAALFIVVACGLLFRQRRAIVPAVLAGLWLVTWIAIAVGTHGASAETLREGVREASIIAIAVIVSNARGTVTALLATRLVQIAGTVPAIIALYQLASHTGLDVDHNIRANGTFSHPNSAAMFFAIAVAASLWRYIDNGRHRSDIVFTALFGAGLVATFSIDGLIALTTMLVLLGALHRGPPRFKLIPILTAGLVVLTFFSMPLGSRRVASESVTSFAAAENGEPNTSLAWRLTRWRMLLHAWKRAPVIGKGLGTTVTEESVPGDKFAGALPHNEYLRYLVETGVLGTALLLGAAIFFVRRLVLQRRPAGTLNASFVSASSLALVIAAGCAVNATADNTLLYSTASYAAILIIAAALSLPSVKAARVT